MLSIFGLPIADLDLAEAVERINALVRGHGQHLVVTANPEILVYAQKNQNYREVLAQADLLLPDGVGVVLVSYLCGQPLTRGRVPGVELVERLIAESGNKGYSLFLIGSSKDILDKTTHYFAYKYSKINIIGYNEGPIFAITDHFPLNLPANDHLIQDIKNLKPDIILVAFGHPKQELWLNYYLPLLPVKVGIGVGGTFDYFAKVAKRAPAWLRKLGLEWLWRFGNEPKRLGRILTAVVVFPTLVLIGCFKKMFHVEH